MWPELLDMTRDECKRVLRRIELEAYSATVSAFRAQGDLSKEKKKMLLDLQNTLSISTERHRAEIRRAVNDEKLATIADNVAGSNAISEWLIEGRRLIPIMPRLVPQTAFTVTANQAANLQAEKNASLPSPSMTTNKDVGVSATTPPQSNSGGGSRMSRPSSPTSNVVVLPSGMSIHIKGGLNTEDDEEVQVRKRRRSTSTESLVSPTGAPVHQVTFTTTAASSTSMSPMKITISKSPQGQPRVVTSGSQTQKVIVVSSGGGGQSTPSIIHKSITVPIVKTASSATQVSGGPNKSIIFPTSSAAGNTSNIVTVTARSDVQTQSSCTSTGLNRMVFHMFAVNKEPDWDHVRFNSGPPILIGGANNSLDWELRVPQKESSAIVSATLPILSTGTSATAFLTPTISISKPRQKMIPRQRIVQIPQQKPGVVIPMGPQPVQPTPQQSAVSQGIQIKPIIKQGPNIQIRQEGGMKIISQSIPGSASKILPRPCQLGSTSTGTPVIVVSASSSGNTTSTVTVLNRPITAVAGQGGTKILNIQTQGGKIISASKGSSLVTVNPKTLHLTAVKGTGLSGTKPNVIVVQKTQAKRSVLPTTTTASGFKSATSSTVITSPFERELVSFLQKQDPSKQYVVTTTTANLSRSLSERRVIVTTPAHQDHVRQARSDSESHRQSTFLQDLIHAAGIVPSSNENGAEHGAGDAHIGLDDTHVPVASEASHTDTASQTKGVPSQTLPNNEWFEYDVTDEHGNTYTHTADSADTAAAIQSLLDMQANGAPHKSKVTVQRSASIDLSQLSDQLSQQQFYTIEQAMNILNQSEGSIEPHQAQSEVAIAGSDDMEITDSREVTSSSQTVPSGTNLDQVNSSLSQEMLPGDLDPQTGLFFNLAGRTSSQSESQTSFSELSSPSSQSSLETIKPLDLLSSSLAQAQIDLDPYQFIETGENLNNSNSVVRTESVGTPTGAEQIERSSVELVSVQDQIEDNSQMSPIVSSQSEHLSGVTVIQQQQPIQNSDSVVQSIPEELPVEVLAKPVSTSSAIRITKAVISQSTPVTSHSIRIKPSSFIPLQEVIKSSKSSTINITTQKQLASLKYRRDCAMTPVSASVPVFADVDSRLKFVLKPAATPMVSVIPSAISTASTTKNIHVTVEPSGLDTSHMKIEDFTSQQITENVAEFTGVVDHFEEINSVDSGNPEEGLSESLIYSDSGSLYDANQFQLVKRKRRSTDDSPPLGTHGGWTRAAVGVLNKVSRYRGMNRDKSDLDAAAWFTQPVDPSDAPDYYSIVKNPMDFGTIRKKLEDGKYSEFDVFHHDMMLVRDNCHLYNPSHSIVRRDCDEVFSFYLQEYNRLLEKWQKTHIGSPVQKKQRVDKSPVRP